MLEMVYLEVGKSSMGSCEIDAEWQTWYGMMRDSIHRKHDKWQMIVRQATAGSKTTVDIGVAGALPRRRAGSIRRDSNQGGCHVYLFSL